jgi:hypothetical protein
VIHWHPAVLGVFKIGSHELFGWFRTVISWFLSFEYLG